VQVAVGEEFSLVLTLTGVVYSFGAGQEGQLGHPNPDDVSKGCPCPIEAFGERSIRVAKIAAGYEHAMAIDGAHTTLALFFLSTDQPTNQPTNQSTNQPTKWRIGKVAFVGLQQVWAVGIRARSTERAGAPPSSSRALGGGRCRRQEPYRRCQPRGSGLHLVACMLSSSPLLLSPLLSFFWH